MHDTPSKNLFGEDMRFHSSGCVRVQNVRELVNWLLVETPGWSRQEIDAVIKSGERKDARVPAGAALLGLRHRLGDARRRHPVPRGHLQPRRTWLGRDDPARLSPPLQQVPTDAVRSCTAFAPPARPSFRTARSSAWSSRAAWCRRSSASDSAGGRAPRAGAGFSRSPPAGLPTARCPRRPQPGVELRARGRRPAALAADMGHLRGIAREEFVGGLPARCRRHSRGC